MLLVRFTAMRRVMGIIVTGLLLAGCMKNDPPGTSSVSITPATRAALLAEAQSNYTYGAERASLTVAATRLGGPGGVMPPLTISTATRTNSSGRLAGSRFIGRLTSGGAYPLLGIAPGINYMWRDSLGVEPERARTLMIPENGAYPMYWLQHDSDRTPLYTAGSTALPRLVQSTAAYGACDSGCSGGHCVMTRTNSMYSTTSDATAIMSR